jgi:hypothetical protein
MTIKQIHKAGFWFIILVIVLFNLNQLFTESKGEISSPVIITEFMAANQTGLTDEDGDYSDWIEIYNQSNEPVNLAGWSLTDAPNQPEKWIFPEKVLPSSEYLVIFASGKDRKYTAPDTSLHANFKLNKANEVVALYNPTVRRFSDAIQITYPQQFSDISYGRYGDEVTYGYFAQPTPGQPNQPQATWTGTTAQVDFSVARGFYDTPFSVELNTDTPEATIYYTIDGSTPTETHGTAYTAPIPISSTTFLRAVAYKHNFRPSAVNTHSYIFLTDVLAQPSTPPPFLTDWGTYPEDTNEHPAGSPVLPDYEMDPEIVNGPRYGHLISDALKSIPSISIVTEAPNYDIYAHPRERGVEWERPVSVEFIYPQEDGETTQTNAGLRIQGGKGRKETMPKHSFRLFFKDEYGATKFKYPLFPDSLVKEFDTLVLRGGVNGSFAGTDRELSTYTRDEWLRASQIEMSGVGSHGIFAHLYLNGLYWGLYNVVERPDASFAASYYGGQKEDWHVRNHNGPLSGDGTWTEGVRYNFINAQTDPEKFAAIEPFIDLTQFSDYVILNWYAGNVDWARKNFFYAVQNPAGPAKYFAWDGEKIWLDGASIYFSDKKSRFGVEAFFDALIWQPDFKILFADRMYKHLFNNGTLTDGHSISRWNNINNTIDLAIIGESARWGDAKREPPYTRDDWLAWRQEVSTQMEGNAAKLIDLAREAGYYPPIDPPTFNQQGGTITEGFKLTLNASAGEIYYTLDGSDPRATGGEVSPQALEYHSPLTLTADTQVKARALTNQTWSALNQARFFIEPPERDLVITEIMYNPLGGDDYEFIELKNIGTSTLNLSNATFEGIRFTFANGTTLAPGQNIVLARNPTAFSQRYPDVSITDAYAKNLSNKGETITLRSPGGDIVVSVAYDDENGWPISPDGRGDSLVLLDPKGDLNDPQNWRASTDLHGSPGAED